jgi:hypothetical protein
MSTQPVFVNPQAKHAEILLSHHHISNIAIISMLNIPNQLQAKKKRRIIREEEEITIGSTHA